LRKVDTVEVCSDGSYYIHAIAGQLLFHDPRISDPGDWGDFYLFAITT